MIDIENEIFNMIAKELRSKFPKIFVTGENVGIPPQFPCVSIVETSNTTLKSTMTSSDAENHAMVTYEVNVYTNKTSGKKTECKKIADFIDAILILHNFDRTMSDSRFSSYNSTIYRQRLTYKAVVSKDKTIYRR